MGVIQQCLPLLLLGIYLGLCTNQVSGIYPFELTYTPARVVKGVTPSVNIRCKRDARNEDGTFSSLVNISWMRILKGSNHEWTTLAEVWRDGNVAVMGKSFTATGSIKEPNNAYLELTWPLANNSTFGTYKCDVVGTDTTSLSAIELTSEVEIVESDVKPIDVLGILLNVREQMKGTIGTMIKWPTGQYALLKPDSGCPLDLAFLNGGQSYLRFSSSEHIVPQDTVSAIPEHQSPGSSSYYLDLAFCEVGREVSRLNWPEGNYCVNKKQSMSCPTGMQSSYVDFKRIRFYNDHFGNIYPESNGRFRFCCKHASSDKPMNLPTDTPFYLYRYGGKCQPVTGMKVERSFLPIRIKIGSNSKFAPDLTVYGGSNDLTGVGIWAEDSYSNDVAGVELCFYTKLP